MDKIEIKITRNCDAQGNGGTVVDHASGILGNVSGDEQPMLDAIVAAFQDAYGVLEVEGVPVTGYRNVAYRMRQFMTEITTSYLKKMALETVNQQIEAQMQHTLGSVTILDQV